MCAQASMRASPASGGGGGAALLPGFGQVRLLLDGATARFDDFLRELPAEVPEDAPS